MRQPIPDRRECETRKVVWRTEAGGHEFYVSAGYHDGKLVEVFYADGMKSGTDLRNMAQDACVLISLLLQHGSTPDDIGKSLSAAPVMGETVPASIIGAIVGVLR